MITNKRSVRHYFQIFRHTGSALLVTACLSGCVADSRQQVMASASGVTAFNAPASVRIDDRTFNVTARSSAVTFQYGDDPNRESIPVPDTGNAFFEYTTADQSATHWSQLLTITLLRPKNFDEQALNRYAYALKQTIANDPDIVLGNVSPTADQALAIQLIYKPNAQHANFEVNSQIIRQRRDCRGLTSYAYAEKMPATTDASALHAKSQALLATVQHVAQHNTLKCFLPD